MELTNKHYLGRKPWFPWLVSYGYRFKIATHNLRTKPHYFSKGHQRMELAEKHWLRRKPRLAWLVSFTLMIRK